MGEREGGKWKKEEREKNREIVLPFGLIILTKIIGFIELWNNWLAGWLLHKLSRGEICVANFKASCEWCESG